MAEPNGIRPAKKQYSKPNCIPKSIVEVAALLREELSATQAIEELNGAGGLLTGPILLIELFDGDIGLIQQKLEDSRLYSCLTALENSEESFEIRIPDVQNSSSDPPSLLLLDFRFTIHRSHKVMEEISKNPKLRRVPIAILIDSAEESQLCTNRDSERCWRLKGPLNSSEVVKALRSFLDLWRVSDELLLPEIRSLSH